MKVAELLDLDFHQEYVPLRNSEEPYPPRRPTRANGKSHKSRIGFSDFFRSSRKSNEREPPAEVDLDSA